MPDSGFTSIGKYRILELIGEGAMGVVYRAMDSVLNRTVAVKVMNDAIARQTDLRDRFLREAQAAGSLQHPNVITVYDFGEVDGHLFIAMECVEGADLQALLALHQPLTLQAKLDIAIGALNGLAYAHRRGIIHRDIKPANIRVTEEGTAKIMDFGVARLESSEMTRTGMMVGTPSYMSPEQVTGGTLTPASDLFALGAVLYELLGGAKPFDAPTLHGILYKVVSEDPPDLIQILPGLPPQLGRIVKKALAKSVNARYQSAVEMANDLSAVRASLSGPPSAGTLSLRASVETAVAAHRRESARAQLYRAALVSASTLAVAGAAVLIWSVTTRHRSDGDASAQSASPPAAMSDTTAEARLASRSAAPAPATSSRSEDPELAATPVVGDGSATPRERPSSREAARRASLAPPSSRYAVPSSGGGRVLPSRIHPDSAGAKSPAAPPAARPPERLPAVAANSTSAATSGAAPSSTAAPIATPAAPVVVPRSPPPPTTVAIPPARNASVDIAAAVAAYARAIESRDIAAVRRAYPGMSDEQQRGFEQFFAAARALRVTFTVSGLDVSGPTAEANLVGAYDYVADGKSEHQPVTFRAALRRDAEGTWRLMSVR